MVYFFLWLNLLVHRATTNNKLIAQTRILFVLGYRFVHSSTDRLKPLKQSFWVDKVNFQESSWSPVT